MKGMIFIRESKPKTFVSKASLMGKQENGTQPSVESQKKEYYYTMSIVLKNSTEVYSPIEGYINLLDDAQIIIDNAIEMGYATDGVSKGGPYKQLEIEFNEPDLFKCGSFTFLRDITGVFKRNSVIPQ